MRRVEAEQPPKAVATAFGVDVKTVAKWVKPFAAEGLAGLSDRPGAGGSSRNGAHILAAAPLRFMAPELTSTSCLGNRTLRSLSA
ncbi:helix-turn-helix domain-containing protein [Phenylobacterium sp.]|uniref:helix-turn-helix domain-containing protein n=1 Tax=Phenylobacterium sp. TaxID=1871053 RepID=UPI0037C8453D